MSKRISYLITDNNITVNYDGQTHIVSRKDSLADRLIAAVRDKNLEEIPKLVSTAKRVVEFGQGNFTVQDNQIIINGTSAPEVLSRKIIRFMNEGLPVEPLVKFAENLLKNPSYRAVNELFQFLEKNDHPITENGCFIAYKKVRKDFKDAYTGTIDNSPGLLVEIPRNQVNEDPTQTCSHGLHVANWHYANNVYSAGEDPNMLEVEINPKDVVAVPIDYNQAKIRVCTYRVLGVIDKEHSTETSLRTTPVADRPNYDDCSKCGESLSCPIEDHTCECIYDMCDECDAYAVIDGVCNECGYGDDEICQNCGASIDSLGEDLCEECNEETCKNCGAKPGEECAEDCEDNYPWETEIEDQ
jgi:hypothetical protein